MDNIFRCTACKEMRSGARRTIFCQQGHSLFVCSTCTSGNLFACPQCDSKFQGSAVNSLDCFYCSQRTGTTLLQCTKHKICRDCSSKQSNTSCRICNADKCNKCLMLGIHHKMPCGKHMLCTTCRGPTSNCPICFKSSVQPTLGNCTRCGRRGCDKTFSVHKCEDQVCLACFNEIKKLPTTTNRCMHCRADIDTTKLSAVEPGGSVMESCSTCGKLKGVCACCSKKIRFIFPNRADLRHQIRDLKTREEL